MAVKSKKRNLILVFLKKHYFPTIFIACVFFIGFFVVIKTVIASPDYVYVKIKVGQGLWWVNTARPAIWHIDVIKDGDIQRDLLGNPVAIILNKRYYRSYSSDQFDAYLTLKLKVNKNTNTGEYSFESSSVSVGSPIELKFPQEYLTGTVIELSTKPIHDNYVDKIIYITKRNAFPWEYDVIKIGDKTTDGEDTVFEVLDKDSKETSSLTADSYGNFTTETVDSTRFITVKARLKLKRVGNQYILGEDQLVTPGRSIGISTDNFVFADFVVSKIE